MSIIEIGALVVLSFLSGRWTALHPITWLVYRGWFPGVRAPRGR